MRNNYGNELFHGNLILMFTKDAPSPRLNLSSLCWIGFSRMTFPRISRKKIYFHRILPTSKFVQIHIGCITKVPFKFELLMEKKKDSSEWNQLLIEMSISFFDHQSPYVKKRSRSFQRSHCVAMTSLERASPRANMMPSQGFQRFLGCEVTL